MSEFIEVATTFATKQDAEQLAEELIRRKMAACVQIHGPIESWYEWNGNRERSQEWSCTIKSQTSLYVELEGLLKELHPFDEPQIVAVPIVKASESYANWMRQQLDGKRPESE